ncbi:LURP-one-like protein [Rhynchospora pubera]|uniref:LURP-one-like protein n=1 Tax=Rhynchospora pubera TaxID=906938 RepID=A0AAV8FCJ0_9POAL|nr:LURP-one-like protein [Rhynchospora pubera]
MAASSLSLVHPSPMMAVVGLQFCTPHVMGLTFTKKAFSFSGGDFIISDAKGTVLMKVQGHVLSFSPCRVLCDAAGTPIISMRIKPFSLHQRWNVYRGDWKDQRDLIFTVKEICMLQLKTELDVFLARNTTEQHCNFKVKGSSFEKSWTLYLGNSNTIIARTSRQSGIRSVLLGKDIFRATVYPNVDYAFVVAIIVILDEIIGKNDPAELSFS